VPLVSGSKAKQEKLKQKIFRLEVKKKVPLFALKRNKKNLKQNLNAK
jgi:hypothetical protein